MDHFRGITAEIVSNGEVLNFYEDPDRAETRESHARYYYVEAVAGSTFQVKVNLTPQFDFYEMKPEHVVCMKVMTDGNLGRKVEHTKKFVQKKFLQGKLDSHTFKGLTQYCKETGQWMKADYSFGNLVLKEITESGLSVAQAQELGKIQVTVDRVKMKKRRVAKAPGTSPIEMINEVPEKALKGRSIETTVRLANPRPTSKPPVKTEYSISINGEAGKPVVFNIYYRSRRALQMLGCIPRSPSPAIAVKPESDSFTMLSSIDRSNFSLTTNAASPNDLLRQIQILNETSVKREREEDTGNERSNQRRRTSVKIEHVDLTDD